MAKSFFDSITMLTKITKEEFYGPRKTIEIWDVDVDNNISKLIQATNNFKYLIGSLDDVIRPLALILPKISWSVKLLKIRITI